MWQKFLIRRRIFGGTVLCCALTVAAAWADPLFYATGNGGAGDAGLPEMAAIPPDESASADAPIVQMHRPAKVMILNDPSSRQPSLPQPLTVPTAPPPLARSEHVVVRSTIHIAPSPEPPADNEAHFTDIAAAAAAMDRQTLGNADVPQATPVAAASEGYLPSPPTSTSELKKRHVTEHFVSRSSAGMDEAIAASHRDADNQAAASYETEQAELPPAPPPAPPTPPAPVMLSKKAAKPHNGIAAITQAKAVTLPAAAPAPIIENPYAFGDSEPSPPAPEKRHEHYIARSSAPRPAELPPTPPAPEANPSFASENSFALPPVKEASTSVHTLPPIAVDASIQDLPPAEPLPWADRVERKKEPKQHVYQSPGIVVERAKLHMLTTQPEVEMEQAQQMAALAPAAGTPSNTPLIPLPETVPPAAPVQATPLPPLPSPFSPTPAVTAAAPPATTPAPPTAPLAEVKPLLENAPPPSTPLPTPHGDVDAVLESLLEKPARGMDTPKTAPPPLAPLPTEGEITEEAPAMPKSKVTAKKSTKTSLSAARSRDTKYSKPVLAMLPPPDPKHPATVMSQASRNVVQKMPKNLDHKKQITGKPFSINHSKDTSGIFHMPPPLANDGDETATHEGVGIKIEVKTPKFNANYELEKAYDELNNGHTDAAAGLYKDILEHDPKNKNALFGLATLYHRAGQIGLARPFYAKLLAVDPNNRDGWNNFLVLLSQEAPEDALMELGGMEVYNPDFSAIPAQMSLIYDKIGQPDLARAKMARAIELSPDNLTYRYNLAIMLDKQHRYEEAGKLYWQIIQAYQQGQNVPGNIQKIQQRLTFISSNRQ